MIWIASFAVGTLESRHAGNDGSQSLSVVEHEHLPIARVKLRLHKNATKKIKLRSL